MLVSCVTVPAQMLLAWALALGIGPAPALGATGIGLAMTLACAVGLGLQAILVLRAPRALGLLRARPDASGAADVVRLGWPVSLQQSLLQLGLMAIFAIVSRIGVAEAAVANVLASLAFVPLQTATAFGVAAATLVGQALGRGDAAAATAWGWRVSLGGAALLLPFGLAVACAPHAVLGLFLVDPQTLALAVGPARIVGAAVAVHAFALTLGFALRGAGATRAATLVPFVAQWGIQLPLLAWLGLGLGLGLAALVASQLALVLVEAAAYAAIWRSGVWRRVRVLPGQSA
jgi:Na+-driven multidrug efflux pump